jgi:hypothetical protein
VSELILGFHTKSSIHKPAIQQPRPRPFTPEIIELLCRPQLKPATTVNGMDNLLFNL